MKLFPYQLEGAKWLTHQTRALLADEMGLGKTRQVIAAFQKLGLCKILVLCPASARGVWRTEIEDNATYDYDICTVYKAKDYRPHAGIYIISYTLAAGTLHETLVNQNYELLVCDESHFLKEITARCTKSIVGGRFKKDGRIHALKGIAHQATRTWFLSGTPAPNNVSELWTTLKLFGVTKHNRDGFIRRYCTTKFNGFEHKILGNKRVPELKAIMEPIMLRRTKKQVSIELPPLHITTTPVEPCKVDLELWFPNFLKSPHIQQQMKEAGRNLRDEWLLADDEERIALLRDTTHSIATLRRYTGTAKLDGAVEYVEMLLASGVDKVVVFAFHPKLLHEMGHRLRTFQPCIVTGKTVKRDYMVHKFQTVKGRRLFLGQIQAAGTAITLTAATHIVMVEADWVPANNAQAIMRCHRIGQKNPVFATFLSLAGSLDESIQKVLAKKTADLAQIFD